MPFIFIDKMTDLGEALRGQKVHLMQKGPLYSFRSLEASSLEQVMTDLSVLFLQHLNNKYTYKFLFLFAQTAFIILLNFL